MKNDLTCEVVQDLLPSYVDHLTSDVTNTAIETHIRECADCRRILSDMQTPEQLGALPKPKAISVPGCWQLQGFDKPKYINNDSSPSDCYY